MMNAGSLSQNRNNRLAFADNNNDLYENEIYDAYECNDTRSRSNGAALCVHDAISRLDKKIKIREKKDQITFYKNSNDNYLTYDRARNIIVQTTKRRIEYIRDKEKDAKWYNIGQYSILVFNRPFNHRTQRQQPQSIWSWVPISGHIHKIVEFTNSVRSIGDKVLDTFKTPTFKVLILDIVNFLINTRDGYFTVTKFITTLISIITLATRIDEAVTGYKAQDWSFSDIILGMSIFGVPANILEKLKVFVLLSGKRLNDCNVVMDLVAKFCQVNIELLDYLIVSFPVLNFLNTLRDIFESIFKYFLVHGQVKTMAELYTKYVKNTQVMFDPLYRESVITLYKELSVSVMFLAYINDVNNRHANIIWKAFCSNIVKYAQTYDASGRKEPICIVFEGPPGCGKSVLMNNLVEVLRKANRSVYVHSCPPVETGKDFYDDYENQEVFVMDDVGQQGVSQWRSIINFVSPVRYPLECASADKKNTKFFNSRIILITTNRFEGLTNFLRTDCIETPEALFRRVHLIKCSRAETDIFKINLTYKKYDYVHEMKWLNKFVGIHSSIVCPTKIIAALPRDALTYVYQVILSILKCEEINYRDTEILSEDIDNILTAQPLLNTDSNGGNRANIYERDTYYDAIDGTGYKQQFDSDMMADIWNGIVRGSQLMFESSKWFISNVMSTVNTYVSEMFAIAIAKPVETVLSSFLGAGIAYALTRLMEYFFSGVVVHDKPTDLWRRIHKEHSIKKESYKAQGGLDNEIPKYISDMSRYSRIILASIEGKVVYTHVIVSGEYLILPSHLNLDGQYIDIYQTWDHLDAEHKEVEQVKINLIKDYKVADIAIYKFEMFRTIYKKCKSLFKKSTTRDPFLYMVSGNNIFKMLRGLDVIGNEDIIAYSNNHGEFKHNSYTGLVTPISGNGLCGSYIVDSAGCIIAMHVAGDEVSGFAVIPNRIVSDDINKIIANCRECEYDVDNKIIPDFSGVRLRYTEGSIDKKYPVAKTSFVPSPFHKDVNIEVRNVVRDLDIEDKGPPIIDKPIATLEKIAQKTFQHQGTISIAEERHIEAVIETMMCDFDELTWEDTIFGNDEVTKINKDSSNGYGMLPSKNDYFDFENRKIHDTAFVMLENFRSKVEEGNVNITDILCVESFKDELRVESKRHDPRTFRVMPLPHILWSKKIFGNLIKHFKKNMHKTGICVGFNPYVDIDIVARKLRKCDVTCDLDFKKWDGTLMARILKCITRVFLRKYQGSNRKMLEELMLSTYNSAVLVFDAIYQTTHGLPSGTWLTLLLNCLYNKSLTILTLYRHGYDNIHDVYNVVDYVVGDDKVCGASGEYAKAFNAKTIEEVARSLGMTCTNGDKTPITSIKQEFNKLNFVKRNFVYMAEFSSYMGKLSLSTIWNTIQWVDKSKDINETLEGKCRSMQVESYLHGPLLYNAFMTVVSSTCPQYEMFTTEEVINILKKGDYLTVARLSGKDVSWLEIDQQKTYVESEL